MGEIPFWAYMVPAMTVVDTCEKNVTVKIIKHKKTRVLVCQAAIVDGNKLPSLVSYKTAKPETAA